MIYLHYFIPSVYTANLNNIVVHYLCTSGVVFCQLQKDVFCVTKTTTCGIKDKKN